MAARGQRLAQLAAEAAGAPTPGAALRRVAALRRELDAFERAQVSQALGEGASFAAIARDLGLSRQAVHRRFRNLSATQTSASGDTARVLRYAREEAAALGDEQVRSEHVLLGVLRTHDLPAAILLRAAGLTVDEMRSHLRSAPGRGRLFRREDLDTEELHALLGASTRRAGPGGGAGVQVEQLLLEALEDPGGGASLTLRGLGVDPDAIRANLNALLEAYAAADVD
jgi:ATP-dependent Clp protease ATP-binding subunit ClpA